MTEVAKADQAVQATAHDQRAAAAVDLAFQAVGRDLVELLGPVGQGRSSACGPVGVVVAAISFTRVNFMVAML